ncbi:MAG: LysR family transcriptional regulator [Alphaproteobacteria bacterium]|nr:LysR family transcriptional regulator [Alphaproteobacteria bacterium]
MTPGFDPVLLNTFVEVAKARSFTEAGRRLGLRQSTVSQHVRKLEQAAGRRLFVRDTHNVTTTPDGEAMLGLAQGILDANDRARRYFAGSELRGRLRFGASEDFVLSRLPEVLRDFIRVHSAVDLELTVALSGALFEELEAGRLDLVLAKRRPGEERGRLVRRERLVWVAINPAVADPDRPLPLILYPPPSISRAIALEALERAGRSWRIVCTSASYSGLRAAALAGLGITVQADGFVPAGLTMLPTSASLPALGAIEFVIVGAGRALRGPAAELAAAILDNVYRL